MVNYYKKSKIGEVKEVDSVEIANIMINAYAQAFKVIEPYLIATLLGMLGVAIIKMLIGKLIDFFMFESSAAEIRRTKRSAFNLIDLISSISDILPKKKDK